MNASKKLNFLQLKKNFLKVFTGIRGFWISIGISFLILLILFFVFVCPLSNRYNRTYKEIEDLSTALERYAVKKDLYNNAWGASKKLEADLNSKELENCNSFLTGKDNRLEAVFLVEDPQKGLISIEDEVLWKNEYLKRISGLLTQLAAKNIILSEGALPFHDWGVDIPTWETIFPVQKRFWIIEAFIRIVLNNTGITKLEKITFRDAPNSYDAAFAQLYNPIPITFKAELLADHIKFLIYEILKSDIPFIIEGITILSTDKIMNPNPSRESENVLIKDVNNQVSNPIIDVTIDAYVIDYKK